VSAIIGKTTPMSHAPAASASPAQTAAHRAQRSGRYQSWNAPGFPHGPRKDAQANALLTDTSFPLGHEMVGRRTQPLCYDPLFIEGRVQLAMLAARYALPAVYPIRANAEVGAGLAPLRIRPT
jgi:hypothetical protein